MSSAVTPAAVHSFLATVQNRFGLSIDSERAKILIRRLDVQREQTAYSSLAAYFDALLATGNELSAEWDAVIELFTNHETYLFREATQLEYIVRQLPLFREKLRVSRPLILWSAGCATGEEAYSLAMLIRSLLRWTADDVRVHGSDLSSRCIAIAEAGHFSKSSFRVRAPDPMFVRPSGDGYDVLPEVRSLLTFRRFNLLDEQAMKNQDPADVILCRNVLIYLSPEARAQILQGFYRNLRVGGLLFLGRTEAGHAPLENFVAVPNAPEAHFQKPRDR